MKTEIQESIVFFDGDCNFCNNLVGFVLKRTSTIKFASLQSETAKIFLPQKISDFQSLNTLVFVDSNKVYLKSDAVLRLSRKMRGLWPIFQLFRFLLPAIVRDKIYDIIANNRYKWFGQSKECLLNNEKKNE